MSGLASGSVVQGGGHGFVTVVGSLSPSDGESDSASDTFIGTAETLVNNLAPFPKNFKAAHINAESLKGHIDEVRTVFRHQIFDLIAVSESWLKPSIPSSEVSLPGYYLLRNDRVNKKCGGVAVYIKSNLKAKVLFNTPHEYSAKPEFMFIEIELPNLDLLLFGTCYRPPKIGHFTDFESALLRYMPNYRRVLVMGDMNTDLQMTNRNFDYHQLTTTFESCNMTILPLDATHHTATSDTLIDLIVTNDLSDILHHGQLPVPGISKHDLIYCVSTFKSPKPSEKFIQYRDFKRMDEAAFLRDVYQTQWDVIETLDSVDSMVEKFSSLVINIYDKHAPIVTKRINKRHPKPWITQDILKMMSERDSVYRKAKKTGSEQSMAHYRQLRNRVKQTLRNSRLRYINSLFSERNQSSRDLWRNVKKLGFGKQPTSIRVDIPLDEMNDYFVSFCSQTNTPYVNNQLSVIQNQISEKAPLIKFNFIPITELDTLKAMNRIKSNATGSDNVSIFLIKKILPAVLSALTFIFNVSLNTNTFPTEWKRALVKPLNKVPSPSVLQDYRPISILPALSKGLERIVHIQITNFLNTHNLMNVYQSGFRQHHSTETALLRVTDDIRLAMDKRQCTVLTLFDFSKAFDTVNHDILLLKLEQIGFTKPVLNWVRSYLTERFQCVYANNTMSKWKPVTCGVPQGSILGPLLFSIYTNDITAGLLHTKYHCYADDLQLYAHCKIADLNTTILNINDDIKTVVEWTRNHGLRLNPDKTKSIVIAYSRLLNSINFNTLKSVNVDGTVVPFCDKVNSLGLTINNTLDWTDYVVTTCKKVFSSIHTLKLMQRVLPFHIKLLLVKSLVFPYFSYCNTVVNDMTVVLSNKLQRSQNYCIRFILDLRRDEHITPHYIRLSILKLVEQRTLRTSVLLYTILKFNLPQYFANDFTFINNEQTERSTRTGSIMLRIPNHRTAIYNKSFIVTACRSWNSLPDSVKVLESRSAFTSAVRGLLLRRMSAALPGVD